MPTKVQTAFRGIGNAISVPHGLWALSISMRAIGQTCIDPLKLVRDAWQSRLCARNAILFEREAFVHLVRVQHLAQWISVKPSFTVPHCDHLVFEVTIAHHQACACVSRAVTCCQLLHNAFEGPKALIDQLSFRSSEESLRSHASISTLAEANVSWDIIAAGTPVGSCQFRIPARTEVIEVSDGEEVCRPQQYSIAEDDDFDRTCQLDWFQGILWQCDRIADSSHHDLRIVFLRAIGACDLHLQGTSDEIKRIANVTAGDGSIQTTTKILLGADSPHCEEKVLVILHFYDLDRFRLVELPSCISALAKFCWNGVNYVISHQNGKAVQRSNIWLVGDDILHLATTERISAGGHHEAPGPRPSLPAGAPFVDRAEFKCNTQGWVASDEMAMYTQAIQWSQIFYKFTPPIFWDPDEDEFEYPDSGEIHIFNGFTTVMPLISNHWSAAEIHRGEQV